MSSVGGPLSLVPDDLAISVGMTVPTLFSLLCRDPLYEYTSVYLSLSS